MTLLEQIPQLKDAELVALLANARRLDIVGTPEQRRLSLEVLPALELEASKRRETRLQLAVKARRPGARRADNAVA